MFINNSSIWYTYTHDFMSQAVGSIFLSIFYYFISDQLLQEICDTFSFNSSTSVVSGIAHRNSYFTFLRPCENIRARKLNIIKSLHLPKNTMHDASSGMIWLVNTYNLDMVQIAQGNLFSISTNYQYTNRLTKNDKLHFDDLIYLSNVAIHTNLYATAIRFLGASIRVQKDNRCDFRTSKNSCKNYDLDNLMHWYISVHNHYLAKEIVTTENSARFYPYRIKSGWFAFLFYFEPTERQLIT